jgi:hypothetical protein
MKEGERVERPAAVELEPGAREGKERLRPLEWRWLPVPPCSPLVLLHGEEASLIGLLC